MTNVKIPWLVTKVSLWRRRTYGTIRLSRCAAGKNEGGINFGIGPMGSKDVLFIIRGSLDLTLVKWTEKHSSPKCKLSEGVSFSNGVVIHPVACGMPTPSASSVVV